MKRRAISITNPSKKQQQSEVRKEFLEKFPASCKAGMINQGASTNSVFYRSIDVSGKIENK